MPKSLFRGVVSLALVFLLVFPRPTFAWGNTGHEAVAYVAWQQMTPAAKSRVMALLTLVPAISDEIPGYDEWVADLPPGLTDDQKKQFLFMRAATWADSIKHHGLQDSDTPPAAVLGSATDVNIGFGDDHSHGYWHFIDTAFASDAGSVPATPTPNVATQIAALRDAIGSDEGDVLKAYDMIWLEHLVGDIHQPLHGAIRFNGGSGDLGGNLVKIKFPPGMSAKFKCPPSNTVPRELHAFWDDLPGSCPAKTSLTAAAAFGKPLPLLLTSPVGSGTDPVSVTDPQAWAADSLALAEKDAYGPPIGPGLKPEGGTSGFLLTTDYYNQAMTDAQSQIALAGARLAKIMNENLK